MEINSLEPIVGNLSLLEGQGAAGTGRTNFDSYLAGELSNVNDKIIAADQNLEAYAKGEMTNIHELLLSIEEAKLSFQLVLQVRNKLLEGVQEVMRMQI